MNLGRVRKYVCKLFLWLTLWTHRMLRPLKVQWQISKMCDLCLSKQREIMQRKMHRVYFKTYCAEKKRTRREEQRPRETLSQSLLIHGSGRVLSIFWGFTDALELENLHPFARNMLGSADCGSTKALNLLGQKQPDEGRWLQQTLRPWALYCSVSSRHSCMLRQEYHKKLPVWVRLYFGSRLLCYSSYESACFPDWAPCSHSPCGPLSLTLALPFFDWKWFSFLWPISVENSVLLLVVA